MAQATEHDELHIRLDELEKATREYEKNMAAIMARSPGYERMLKGWIVSTTHHTLHSISIVRQMISFQKNA